MYCVYLKLDLKRSLDHACSVFTYVLEASLLFY